MFRVYVSQRKYQIKITSFSESIHSMILSTGWGPSGSGENKTFSGARNIPHVYYILLPRTAMYLSLYKFMMVRS